MTYEDFVTGHGRTVWPRVGVVGSQKAGQSQPKQRQIRAVDAAGEEGASRSVECPVFRQARKGSKVPGYVQSGTRAGSRVGPG